MEQVQDFEVPVEELWAAVSEPDLMSWLGDAVDIDVRPGGAGRVVDDGETRELVVETVEPGRRLTFRWWPEDLPTDVSRVELEVVTRPGGSRLVVRETLPAGGRWPLRAALLGLHLAPSRAPRLTAVGC